MVKNNLTVKLFKNHFTWLVFGSVLILKDVSCYERCGSLGTSRFFGIMIQRLRCDYTTVMIIWLFVMISLLKNSTREAAGKLRIVYPKHWQKYKFTN